MPQTAVPILDIFASVTDPRHPSKVQHLWLRQYLSLPNGVPSHDTFARLFDLMAPTSLKRHFATG